jgi:hypothetical protein
VVMQERLLAGRHVFRQHHAGVVLEKTVEHHAVEAAQAAELDRHPIVEFLQIDRAFECGRSRFQPRQQSGHRHRRRRLQLDDQPSARRLEADIEGRTHVRWDKTIARSRLSGADRRLRFARSRVAQHIRQPRPQPVDAAEAVRNVTGRVRDRQAVRVDHEQHAVRLDQARNMDRLAIAQREVDSLVVHAALPPRTSSACRKARIAPRHACAMRSSSLSSRASTPRKLRQRRPVSAP